MAVSTLASAQVSRTLAVIPFANIAQEPADEWIGHGIAETVTTDLRSAGDVEVVGRELVDAAMANAGVGAAAYTNEAALLEIARELGADLLLAGGYQRLGGQLRITARLVDVQSESAVDALKIDGAVADLFALQDQLAAALHTAVRATQPAPLVAGGASGNGGRRAATRTGANGRNGGNGGNGDSGRASVAPAVGDVTGGLVLDRGATPGRAPADAPDAQGRAPGARFAVSGRPTVRAVRATQPPVVDGILDDVIWRDATVVSEFVQSNPVEGAPPTEDTDVWIAYDADHLYFAFYAHYTDTTQIRANRVDRDRAGRDDWFAVMFDTFLDQQRAYRFSVNAYGVQGDAIMSAGRGNRGAPGGGGDRSWDVLFETGGQLVGDGWTAEMAIPFKSLRYPPRGGGEHRWGFQISRTMQTKDETLVWSPVSRDIAGLLTQMGVLGGLSRLSTSRNLEILPTMTAIQLGELNDAGFAEGEVQPDVGLNVKYGVTSNLTADFAVNPDFSQIESDRPQIEVNQRFPLFFPELRPFFLEGQEIFRTRGSVNLVHTRTIVDPRFGGKLTGKTGNATLGVLVANDEAPGKRDDQSDAAFGQTAQFFIGRARYDLYSESYIGGIFTDREFLDSYSRVGGVDGRFRLGQSHSVQFLAVTSANRDEAGNETTGPMFDVRFQRDSRNLDYSAQYNSIDPDFHTEAGFVRRVDVRRLNANVSYDWWPESWIISWGPGIRYLRNVDHQGILQDEDVRADLSFRFSNNIFFRIDGRRELERFNDIDFRKTRFSFRNGINTSRRVSLFYGANWGDQVRFSDSPFLGRAVEFDAGVTLLPTSRLRSQISLDTSRFTDPRTDAEVFNVKIWRAFTTYQFTERLLLRNISEYNTLSGKLGLNVLLTYRVNAGTVFYIGYDDRLQEGRRLDEDRFQTRSFERTRRAFFMKFQYLFRY